MDLRFRIYGIVYIKVILMFYWCMVKPKPKAASGSVKGKTADLQFLLNEDLSFHTLVGDE